MAYEAVIFDLDGTLLDTLEDLADSANKTLGEMDAPAHPVEAYKTFVGDGIEQLMKRALPEDRRDEATVAAAVERQRKNYADGWDRSTRPYDGVSELLTGLHQKHVRMGILSNKPDDMTKLCVTQLLPIHLFTIVQGALPGIPRKPNPAPAMEVAGRLDVLPDRILYVGDTDTDMKTAVNAGMYPVGALWGFRSGEELTAAGAKTLLESPTDLLNLL
ncbi:MAG: HAD family hydrolase [Planctomycetota bacterium]|jgi:phosphoglycolate phosphatase